MTQLSDDELAELDEHALEAMAQSSGSDDRAHRILVDRYSSRGEFRKALGVIDQLLAAQPEGDVVVGPLYQKATILDSIGQAAGAIRCFSEVVTALGEDPASPEDLYMAGMSHYSLYTLLPLGSAEPHADAALRFLATLIRRYPDYEDEIVVSHIGELHAAQRDFAAAIDAYRRALELCAGPDQRRWAQVGLASVYRAKGDLEAAEQLYAAALTGPPEAGRSKVHFELGKLLEIRGRLMEARSEFEAALKLKDESPHLAANPQYLADILWHLAHLAYRRAEVEMALGYLEGALPLISAQHAYFADIHITLGHCHAARGNQTKAREHYNAAAFAPLASSEQIEMAQRCLKEIGEAETA